MKQKVLFVMSIFILTGCSATYNLEISTKGFQENIIVNSTSVTENEFFVEYPYEAYYGGKENEGNRMEKIEGQEYYNSKLTTNEKGLKTLKYNYLFSEEEFNKANSIYMTSFENFIMRRYDHDNNGKKDYMIISTSDDFSWFENNQDLEKVEINITCHYEIISSNADKVNNNTHTWYLDKDNIKPINMVYNPDKIIDYRTFWQKLLDGDYFTPFTISILLLIIGSIIYLILKRKSNKVDAI